MHKSSFQSLHFRDEVFGILKLPVHRSKTDVSDLIELTQRIHDALTDDGAVDFTFKIFEQRLGHIITNLIDLLRCQAFVAGVAESAVKFCAAEVLFSAVAFDDFEFFREQFENNDGFETMESLAEEDEEVAALVDELKTI